MTKSTSKSEPVSHKTVATNRRALAKYEIIETLEAGIALQGHEVKSLRTGEVNLNEGFARIENEQIFLWNVHISPYSHSSKHVQPEPLRTRKLLLNHSEILKWMGRTLTKGLTLVPLEIYFNPRGRVKVKIALARGKKAPDRREDIKKRDLNREMRRAFAEKQKIK